MTKIMEKKTKRNVSCKVNLYLRKNKILSDGTNPILLRCSYHGSSEISTGCSCRPIDWIASKEMVSSRHPMHKSINSIILKIKNDAISRKIEYESRGIAFTASMVVSKGKGGSDIISPEVPSLIDRYISHYNVKSSTVRVWKSMSVSLNGFVNGRQLYIGDISIAFAKRFAGYLEKKKLSSSTIRSYMSKLNALCSFGCQNGLLSENPLDGYNYRQLFKDGSRTAYIHYKSISFMKDYLCSMLVDGDVDSMWSYKVGIERMFNLGRGGDNSLFSLYLFMLMYLFQGLSPIDLCLLKFKDIQFRQIDGKRYLFVETKRQKTGKVVKVTFPMEGYNLMMVNCMLLFRGMSEYLLPIFEGYTPERRDYYTGRLCTTLTRTLLPKLHVHLQRINEAIVAHNVEFNDDVPLIDVKMVRYYTARHSWATNYCLKGGSPLALATLLGRSVNGIATYVRQLSEQDDLVAAVSVMGM